MSQLAKPTFWLWPLSAVTFFVLGSLTIGSSWAVAGTGRLAVLVLLAVFALCAVALWLLLHPDTPVVTTALLSAVIAAALLARLAFFDWPSHDYMTFLAPWVQFFRQNGGFFALRYDLGDYNVPYLYLLAAFSYCPVYDLYLIKLSSVAFDLLLAFGMVWAVTGVRPISPLARAVLFSCVLFLPTVLLNGACWGQCDSMYAAFVALSLGALTRRRRRLAVILAALALSIKLQAIFFLPLGLILLLLKNPDTPAYLRWRDLPWFPATFFITILPAVILGKPLLSTLTIYLNQTQTYSAYLHLNAPSLFALTPNLPVSFGFGLGLTLTALSILLMTFWSCRHPDRFGPARLYAVSAALCVTIPFLLPSMHDRYFFLADVLTLGLVFAIPLTGTRRVIALTAPFLVQTGSYAAYHAYLAGAWLFAPLTFLGSARYGMGIAALFMLLGGLSTLYVLTQSDPAHKEKPQKR